MGDLMFKSFEELLITIALISGSYGVDILNQFSEDRFLDAPGGYVKDSRAALDLCRALQLSYPDESLLEKQKTWTNYLLKQGLSSDSLYGDRLHKNITTDLQRLAIRRRIKHYATDNTRILKTSYRCSAVGSEDFLKLALEDFSICKSMQREELQHIIRWVVDRRLDKLKFARQKEGYCYFSAAATLFAPKLSDARISLAKNGVLTTVVDDFFDAGGMSMAVLVFVLRKLEIIYSELHITICEIGDKSFGWQGRHVRIHVIKTVG